MSALLLLYQYFKLSEKIKMATFNRKVRRKLEDQIAHDYITMKYLKWELMTKYRINARAAKKLSLQIEKDGCEYWLTDTY